MGRPRLRNICRCFLIAAMAMTTVGSRSPGVQAAPRTGRTITRGTTGVERVHKGVWEIGHDQMLLVRWYSGTAPDGTNSAASQLSANFIGGITPRYFVIDNLALGVSVNAFLGISKQTTSVGGQTVTAEHRDIGVLAFAMANYYIRLGFGLFFAPGLGVGGFYGQRFSPDPVDPGRAIQTVLAGGAGRLDLGFVFFASRHVNLRAGLDVLFRVGSEQPAVGDPLSFSSVDAGVHVGVAYAF